MRPCRPKWTRSSFLTEDAELIVVAFGSIGRIAKSTVRKLRAQGHKVGLVRPITLFPFPVATCCWTWPSRASAS
jgi:pyruvate/2-oxoacid:ferredoxin oxidoreductase alpha subunit